MLVNLAKQVGLLLTLILIPGANSPAPPQKTPETKHEVLPAPRVVAATPKPQWQKGLQWTVETNAKQTPERRDVADQKPTPVQWQFDVVGSDKLGEIHCYQVRIDCLVNKRRETVAKLWVDQQSLTLRQLETRLPICGGFRTVRETYRMEQGKPSPVLAPLTAIPIDLPLLPVEGAKALGSQRFDYEAVSTPVEGIKNAQTIGFAYEVEQEISTVSRAGVKAISSDAFHKSLDTDPFVKIELKLPQRTVTQYWQGNLPWPVFSDNGVTQARLIGVKQPK